MKVYLADLFHVYVSNPDTAPYTVPLGIGYVASAIKSRMPGAEVRLFRDPNRFFEAVRDEPPAVVGFSVTSWNTDLTRRASSLLKRRWPGIVTAAGGPCVDDNDGQILDFLRGFPDIDYVVTNEGETGMLALLRHVSSSKGKDGAVVGGCAYLSAAGELVRGPYRMPVVDKDNPKETKGAEISLDDEVPSPILDGTLDEFFDQGLVPIIQTMRGCPYACDFCVSGMTAWNKMRGFAVDRVKAEIDYALDRSGSKDLILTDENWGVLGDRDIEIARYIMERSRSKGSPRRLYYYTTKIVTDTSRAIVEMVAPIAWIGEFTMSFQSLNKETRKAIHRTNITLDKLAFNVEWANKRNIVTSSEMIYGFPYETPASFFEGVETLLKAGMHKVVIYPLQLFAGINLDSREARANYALKTRFRLADSAYGIYAGGGLSSAEVEEVIVETSTSTFADYFKVRRYSFFLTGLLGRLYLTEFFVLCGEAHFEPHSLLSHLALFDCSGNAALDKLMKDFDRDAQAELKASREEVFNETIPKLRRGEKITGVKLNLVYLAKLFSSPQALAELMSIIDGYFEGALEAHSQKELLMTYLREVLPNRIALLRPDPEKVSEFGSRFDYARWRDKAYRDLSDLLLPQPRRWVALLDDVLQRNLEGFDAADPACLQGVFDRTPKRKLLRRIEAAAASQP